MIGEPAPMSQGLILLDTPAEVNHEFVACRGFEGIWISETGSRYLSDGREFVCIRAHHPDFRGWIGKTGVVTFLCEIHPASVETLPRRLCSDL